MNDHNDPAIDPTLEDQPEEFIAPPQEDSRNLTERLKRKVTEANALNKLSYAFAEVISGFAASAGSIMPVILAFVTSGAFVLTGVPIVLAVGVATSELVGIYIHDKYRDKALTKSGLFMYTLAAFMVGLNVSAALFHTAYPTVFAEAEKYGLSKDFVSSFGSLNALAVTVPALTAAIAIVIYILIPKSTEENRAETRKDSLEADKIDFESQKIKDDLEHEEKRHGINSKNDLKRLDILAKKEEAELAHENKLTLMRIGKESELNQARIAAEIEAYGEALEHPAVKAFLKKLALLDLVYKFQKDSGIHPNNKMFKDLKESLITNLLPDMDEDSIPDILQDLEAGPDPLAQRPSQNGRRRRTPAANGQPL